MAAATAFLPWESALGWLGKIFGVGTKATEAGVTVLGKYPDYVKSCVKVRSKEI